MTRRIKVKELMQREGLKGEVVNLFPSWRKGIIHGDDGYDVTFSDDSLVLGFNFRELSIGLRVCYGFFFAAGTKVPTAINMQTVRADETGGACELADKVTPGQVGSGMAS
jgi:hypothetical protein